MNIDQLTANFLNYLEKKNTDAGNPYQQQWLDEQAQDYKHAMQSAASQISAVMRTNSHEDDGNIAKLIQGIHLNCSPATYRIAQNASNAVVSKNENSGVLRKCETFHSKNVPILDCENKQDLNYLRLGKMPKALDGRLQKMKIDLSNLSSVEKERKMHGQPAWLTSNDVIQITAYIESHLGKQESYYFLCAYYKENYLRVKISDPKAVLFGDYINKEITALSKELKLTFNGSTTKLTPEEQTAYDKVYVFHPAADKIASLFATYTQNLTHQIHNIQTQNLEKMAQFCAESIIQYMSIHPFYDANYRTITIFINAVLWHFGYELINFNDLELKKTFNTDFNNNTPNIAAATLALSSRLIKKEASQQDKLLLKYNAQSIGQVIRRMAATGKHKELDILQLYPDKINEQDQTPDKGLTALHWAVKNKQTLCVQKLLSFGARCDILDKMGQTAIDYAMGDEVLLSLLSGKVIANSNNGLKESGYKSLSK